MTSPDFNNESNHYVCGVILYVLWRPYRVERVKSDIVSCIHLSEYLYYSVVKADHR